MAMLFGKELSTEAFIRAFGEKALLRYEKARILPSLIICQALVESSGEAKSGEWLPGYSEIAQSCWNYHGMNYYNDSVTRYYPYETFTTQQERDGVLVDSVEQFCKFSDIDQELDCLYAWYNRRSTAQQQKYYGALAGCTDPSENFTNIRLAGYASASDYSEQLQKMYDRYASIAQFDAQALAPAAPSVLYYFVQAGAYHNKHYAENLMKLIKSRGFPAFIKEQQGYYKVQTGAFQVKENAEAQAEQLKAAGFDAFLAEGYI